MIDIDTVLDDLRGFDRFCSLEDFEELARALSADPDFTVKVAGLSAQGRPIRHIKFGSGALRALIVASPHCMEPIGSLTAYALLDLLRRRHPSLLSADIEWHIVPCIDPDGALLNEGWTQQSFSFSTYLKNYYVQEPERQVDMTFPVSHKKLQWDRPSVEARVLKEIIDSTLPDFFYSLHNTRTGGAFFYINNDIGEDCYREIYRVLEECNVPLQKKAQWEELLKTYSPGILETFSYRKCYDHFETIMPDPEEAELLRYGVGSWEYLSSIKPTATTFTAEIGYVLHPLIHSDEDTGLSLRRTRLQLEAENKYLASVVLEVWEAVHGELDSSSPLYRSVAGGWVLPSPSVLAEGGVPLSRYPTREIISDRGRSDRMTGSELFDACMVDGGFFYHLFAYQLLRLLSESRQTPLIQQSLARLERAFDAVSADLRQRIDFSQFEVIPLNSLAKAQVGTGLAVLNAVLKRAGSNRADLQTA